MEPSSLGDLSIWIHLFSAKYGYPELEDVLAFLASWESPDMLVSVHDDAIFSIPRQMLNKRK